MAGGKVLLSEGVFVIANTVGIDKNGAVLAGVGPSTVLKADPSLPLLNAQVRVGTIAGNFSDIVIRDLAIDGNSANIIAAAVIGLVLGGTTISRFLAQDLYINDVKGTGISAGLVRDSTFRDVLIRNAAYMGFDGLTAGSEYVLLDHIHTVGTGQEGIFINYVHHALLRSCIVEGTTANSGIHLHGDNVNARSNVIDGCHVHGAGQHGIEIAAGGVADYKRMIVVNCHVSDCESDGLHLVNVVHSLIENNIAWNNGQTAGDGIALEDSDENIVAGNHCYDDQGTKTQVYGIHETGSSDWNLFHGNNLRGNDTGDIAKVGANSVEADNL